MIQLGTSSKLFIPELENASKFTVIDLWIEYGINGILPRLKLKLEGFSSEVEYSTFSFKLIFNNIEYSNCKCSVESFDVENTYTTITAYMVDSLEFIKGRTTNSYKSLAEVVNSLWRGENNFELPQTERLYLTQCNETNHTYLTTMLSSAVAEQAFYYGLNRDINPVKLSNQPITYDLTKETLPDNQRTIISVKGRTINSFKSKFALCEDLTERIVEKYYSIAGDIISYSDALHYKLEENYIRSLMVLSRKEYQFEIEYDNRLDIKVGDIIKTRVNETGIITFLILSTQIYIRPDQMKIVSRCIEYGN